MNHARQHNQAVSGARRGRLARVVRLGVVACALAATGVSALAQDRNGRRDDAQRYQMQAQVEQDPRFEQRANEVREEQRRQMEREAQMRVEARRNGRMTPDERRDLRRQINEAGVDVYPNARRR